jgi:hypothetical protein
VCCVSAGADRREGGICADPAYVVTPQAKKKKKKKRYAIRAGFVLHLTGPSAMGAGPAPWGGRGPARAC